MDTDSSNEILTDAPDTILNDPWSLFDLSGRVAIVTGASSGLGDRFARLLHASGATVVVAARRLDRLEALAADLGDRVTVVEADLTDGDDRTRVVEAASSLGSIDVLVNNAGYGTPEPAETESVEHYQRIMDINLNAVFYLTQSVGTVMLDQRKGSIINIASILGFVGSAPIKEASYCAAKGAVVNLTRALGAEWARKGVRVNAIAPGWFPSEMTQEEMFDSESGLNFVEQTTPMGRGGRSHELDSALLFLAGDGSSYVTGQTVAVDGGWLAR